MWIKVDVLLLAVFAVCVVISDAKYCDVYKSCIKQCYRRSRYYTKCGLFGWDRCTRYRTVQYPCVYICSEQQCCTGYTGDDCLTPKCTNGCPNGGTCTRPDVCSCRTGFSSPFCSDINECSSSSHGCQHNCVNTHGSYYCTCRTGYTKHSDLKSCIDEDECKLGNSGCTQICHNTIGSYTCSCNVGFTLDVDGRTCNDVDECTDNTATCDVHCKNTIGSYQCYCEPGYMVDGDMCEDIDECQQDNGQCDHICLNEPGSYYCDCQYGYRLHNRQQCQDIDECKKGISGCSHSCLNHNGSYTCTCPSGFVLSTNNRTCEDMFTDNTNKCEVYETIIQQCEEGYQCEVVEDDPICRPTDKDQYEFNYLTVVIPIPVILLLVIGLFSVVYVSDDVERSEQNAEIHRIC